MTIDVGTASYEELPARFAQGLAGLPQAEAPDLFMTGPEVMSMLPPLAQTGAAHDLAPMLKNSALVKPADFWADGLDTGKVQGKQITLPAQVGAEVLVYNKRLFQEGNINPPPAGWTWDQFIGSAKALSKPGQGDEPPRWGAFVGTATPTLASLAWQHGAQLIPEDGSRIDLTEPGTLRALGNELCAVLANQESAVAVQRAASPWPGFDKSPDSRSSRRWVASWNSRLLVTSAWRRPARDLLACTPASRALAFGGLEPGLVLEHQGQGGAAAPAWPGAAERANKTSGPVIKRSGARCSAQTLRKARGQLPA